MKRLYVIVPFLAVTAFAGYYHYWERTQCPTCAIPARTPLVGPREFQMMKGHHDAEADFAAGNMVLLTYGMPGSRYLDYRGVLQRDYHIEDRMIAGCIVDDDLVAYADGYNETMRRHIIEVYGPDIFGAANRKAEALYAERNARDTSNKP